MHATQCDRCKRGNAAKRLLIPLYGGTYRQVDLCLECLDDWGDLFTVFIRCKDLDDLFRRYIERKTQVLATT